MRQSIIKLTAKKEFFPSEMPSRKVDSIKNVKTLSKNIMCKILDVDTSIQNPTVLNIENQ